MSRQTVLEALKTRLEAIQIADGFQTDAGSLVVLGEIVELGEADPDAAIAIIVRDEEVPYQGENILIRLPIDIQAMAKASLSQPWVTIEHLLQDIKQAVELEDRRLSGLLRRDLERGPTRTLEREPGSTTVGAAIPYVALLVEGWGGS